jgi:hypothetical protein
MLVRRVRKASNEGLSMDWLMPYMTKRQVHTGQILFRKGQPATEMFIVSSGRLRSAKSLLMYCPVGWLENWDYWHPTSSGRKRSSVSKTPKSCRSATIASSQFISRIRASVSICCVLRVPACFKTLPSLKKNWNTVARSSASTSGPRGRPERYVLN